MDSRCSTTERYQQLQYRQLNDDRRLTVVAFRIQEFAHLVIGL